MKKYFALLMICLPLSAIKILHMSCHMGCIDEFKRVAQELSLDLTSWYVMHPTIYEQLTGEKKPSYNILNMSHEKAEAIWNKNKNYFMRFDLILTSDTAPLSRIFLQNNWPKKLIIWVCNRFDYRHEISAGTFPDPEYYDLIRAARFNPNVSLTSYTPYEYEYAQTKQVDIGTQVIKPIGAAPGAPPANSTFPDSVKKHDIIFISQTAPAPLYKQEKKKIEYIQKQCANVGIKTWAGRYNGADDLIGIKGVLHFPYQASNLMLFENIQRGIIHFVPSPIFLAMARTSAEPEMPCKNTAFWLASHEQSEWYLPENKDLFVYFDSWNDLRHKIDTLDYEQKRRTILQFAHEHKITMLHRWKLILKS